MNQLAKIEVARQALAEAKEIKDVKVILDKAEAVKHFLKQQNYTIEIQNYANVFCIEAQIKLGEMLKEMPKNEGTKGRGRPSLGGSKTEPPKEQPPTYAELNINKKDASRCQQIAEETKIIKYFIGDLSVFRKCNMKPVAVIPNDPPDSKLAVYKISQFPKNFILKTWLKN